MRFGSVCSGIEAASVAWHPLGWQAAWLAEIEPFPSAVLAHHYPGTPNLGDMTGIAKQVLLGNIEAPDVLTGGTPCQAFSVAGLRQSLADARGNLTLKFVELLDAIDHVRELRGREPAIAIWENVPGVLSTKDNAFGCFLAGLAGEDEPLQPPGGKWANAGAVYGPSRAIAWRTLDAQYFGLAQRRRRVFVVASARKGFDPAQVLFEWEGVRRDSAPSRETREEAAGTLAGGARKRGGYSTDDIPISGTLTSNAKADNAGQESKLIAYGGNRTSGPRDVASALSAPGGTGRHDFETETFITHSLRGEGFDASEDGTGRGTPLVPVMGVAMEDPVPPLMARSSRGGAQTLSPGHQTDGHMVAVSFHGSQDPGVSGAVTHPVGRNQGQETCVAYTTKLHNTGSNNAGKLFEERTTCLDANSPPPALLTAMQVRRLTPEECEALQGFPRSYTAIPWRGKQASDCPDGPRYKALGNSWAVPCARWIGERVIRHLAQKARAA